MGIEPYFNLFRRL